MKANFQKGFMPCGSDDAKALVTAQMSTIMKATESSMDTSRTPKRGDTLMSSMRPNSYLLMMFQNKLQVVKIHHGSLKMASYGRV